MYFNVNNLYDWSMTQCLPYGDFKWIENIDNSFNWKVCDDSKIGYILKVDLEYPRNLHDIHNDLPFCAEKNSYWIKGSEIA